MFLEIVTGIFLFHSIMMEFFEERYINLQYKFSYLLMYIFSFIEIKIKNIFNQIGKNEYVIKLMDSMENSNDKNTPTENDVEIISDNKVIKTCGKKNAYLFFVNDCNFMIYSEKVQQTSRTNKVIIHNKNKLKNDTFKCVPCKYMFISVELYIQNDLKEVNYNLKLFSNGDNYYMANNKIDRYVICFLLEKQYGIYFNPEKCKYRISIIDQSANMVELCHKDVLILYEDNYEIIEVIGDHLENIVDVESVDSNENDETKNNYEIINEPIE